MISFVSALTVLLIIPSLVQYSKAGSDTTEIIGNPPQRASRQPFTVADSIAMERIIEPEHGKYLAFNPLYNADGSHFVIATRQGDLERQQNEYKIILFSVNDVVDYVNEKASGNTDTAAGIGEVVATLYSDFNSVDSYSYKSVNSLRDLKWLSDGRTLTFIGRHDHQTSSQLFSLDIVTKRIRQLTNHPRSVISADVDLDSGSAIYVASLPHFGKGQEENHFRVGKKLIENILFRDEERPLPVKCQYYAIQFEGNTAPRTVGEPFFSGNLTTGTRVWLAPGGQMAIGYRAPATLSADWLTYEPMATNSWIKNRLQAIDPDSVNASFPQFALIDMIGGTVEDIFGDAPSSYAVAGSALDVYWLEGDRAIISHSFLPLGVANSDENERRRKAPAIVEYDIGKRQLARVTDISNNEWHRGLWLRSDGVLTKKQRERAITGVSLPDRFYKKQGQVWQQLEAREAGLIGVKETEQRLLLSIEQGLNAPPELFARDVETGNTRRLTDLNPHFRHRTLGKVEKFTWTDRSGQDWQGGIVYPPNYQSERRYPLVIQTHGFNADEFLVDGPLGMTTAYAAQSLANRNILVLQMQDNPPPGGANHRVEIEAIQTGVESVIDRLDSMALIDKQRVGLIGFSATGSHVQHLITFSEYPFAAATAADGFAATLWGYINLVNRSGEGMQLVEDMLDAVPWGEKLSTWVSRSPELHLDQVKTPLRIEVNDSKYVSFWWDIYAILKRQQKPVEFWIFPSGTHNLKRPLDRFGSQQGNVDWFDFWLNGSERIDPYLGAPESKESLEEQYARWRKLRELQEKSEVEAIKARAWHKEQEAKRQNYEQWLTEQVADDNAASTIDAVNQ